MPESTVYTLRGQADIPSTFALRSAQSILTATAVAGFNVRPVEVLATNIGALMHERYALGQLNGFKVRR